MRLQCFTYFHALKEISVIPGSVDHTEYQYY